MKGLHGVVLEGGNENHHEARIGHGLQQVQPLGTAGHTDIQKKQVGIKFIDGPESDVRSISRTNNAHFGTAIREHHAQILPCKLFIVHQKCAQLRGIHAGPK